MLTVRRPVEKVHCRKNSVPRVSLKFLATTSQCTIAFRVAVIVPSRTVPTYVSASRSSMMSCISCIPQTDLGSDSLSRWAAIDGVMIAGDVTQLFFLGASLTLMQHKDLGKTGEIFVETLTGGINQG